METNRHEFEELVKGNFKVPKEAFVATKPDGYYNGHLNAYFKVFCLAKQQQATRINELKRNLWRIVESTMHSRSECNTEILLRQVCMDLRTHLDDLK